MNKPVNQSSSDVAPYQTGHTINTTQTNPRTCALAKASSYLGICSVFLLIVGTIILERFDSFWYFGKPAIGLFFACLVTAVSAIATGFLAEKRIAADPSLCGNSWAKTGAAMGCVMAFPIFVASTFLVTRQTHILNACISQLRQIDGAKEQWAFENKKTVTDIPNWNDLIGADKYIKSQPICPGGGTFTLSDMAHKPLCSIAGHSL